MAKDTDEANSADSSASSLSVIMASSASSTVSSRRSSFSSSSVFASDIPAVTGTPASHTATENGLTQPRRSPTQHTMDPLSRTYPKPDKEINVAEALARPPQKWSLGYWTKNARDLPPPASFSREGLERVKQELRQAKDEMSRQRPTR